jgi:hypothetical protein
MTTNTTGQPKPRRSGTFNLNKAVSMHIRSGDLRFEIRLDVLKYAVSEFAQIACSTLRVATPIVLPFKSEAILRAQQFEDGLYLLDRDEEIAVRFAPGLPTPALEIFVRNRKHGVPVVLSEENLSTNSIRSWLVMPLDPRYQLVAEDEDADAAEFEGETEEGSESNLSPETPAQDG